MKPQVKATTPPSTYTTSIEARTHQLVADEPISENGKDLGMAPNELLAASLASCTSITLRMYTDRKEWNTGNISVTVEIEKNELQQVVFTRKIHLENELEAAQKDRIIAIANACPVHKILSGQISVETKLINN